MDDLSQSLSRFNIGDEQSPNWLRDVLYHDQVITRIQETQLTEAQLHIKLNPNHEISMWVNEYCRDWKIPIRAAQNFMSLACGNLKFPVLLLQNPSRNHEELDFETMVKNCPTLVWLEGVLRDVGLSLDDVIILDVCPLLSDVCIELMTEDQAEQAIKEAYNLIENILVLLKPELLIACQCATSYSDTRLGRHASKFAKALGSSVRAAKAKRIDRVEYREHIFNVILAFHPRNFIGRHDPNAGKREILLKEILSHFLLPCGKWKAQVTALLELRQSLASLREVIKESTAQVVRLSEVLIRCIEELESGTTAPAQDSATVTPSRSPRPKPCSSISEDLPENPFQVDEENTN